MSKEVPATKRGCGSGIRSSACTRSSSRRAVSPRPAPAATIALERRSLAPIRADATASFARSTRLFRASVTGRAYPRPNLAITLSTVASTSSSGATTSPGPESRPGEPVVGCVRRAQRGRAAVAAGASPWGGRATARRPTRTRPHGTTVSRAQRPRSGDRGSVASAQRHGVRCPFQTRLHAAGRGKRSRRADPEIGPTV